MKKGFGKLKYPAALLVMCAMCFCLSSAEEPVYDFAYVRNMKDCAIYYIFDVESGTVKQFRTNDSVILVGSFTGDLSRGALDISYRVNWHETFTLVNPPDESLAVLTDFSGVSYEYTRVDTDAAAQLMRQGGYSEMRLE